MRTPTGCVRGWTNWHASATACRTRCGRLVGPAAQLEAQLRQCSVDRERLSDELHADADGLRARLDELARERNGLQDEVREARGAQYGLKPNALGASVECLERSPLEVLAARSSSADCSGLLEDHLGRWCFYDAREKKLAERMAFVRLKEKKLLAVAYKLRARHEELSELERRLRPAGGLCEVKSEVSPSPDVVAPEHCVSSSRVREVERNEPLLSMFDATQLELLRATEAYRDFFYQHVLEEVGAAEFVDIQGRECPSRETPLEKTLHMSRVLERVFSDKQRHSCTGSSEAEQSEVTLAGKDLCQRSLEAFRRIEKAMGALS
ncbi:uncharacterized protein Tco025E_05083 [Trypanosoma conorhini]|uniref:Uncharacterized protein n=1 Tax=Trypanosoma conorhini TaxID=83891 RepID=A0A3R7N6E1_9TRYP|nr:uncharacterized protein Tco025E_05083 [Trypanosoma conorhini]RNF16928.1 hypothetical protein Tco025E_05083 [Trypanosoma conorhini]